MVRAAVVHLTQFASRALPGRHGTPSGRWRLRLCQCLALLLLAVPAIAQEAASDSLADLQGRITALEQEIKRLEQVTGTSDSITGGPQFEPGTQQTSPPTMHDVLAEQAVFNQAPGAATPLPKLVDPVKYPIINLSGFFQADAGWANQDEDNLEAVGNVENGADFRRARLAAIGDVFDNVRYKIEFDFGFPGRPNFTDVWLEIHDLPTLGNVRVGQWKQPIGIEAATNIREITFVERALPFVFLPFRQIGIMAHDKYGDNAGKHFISVYRYPSDPFGGDVGDDGGVGMATRLTYLPIYDEKCEEYWHLGVAYTGADPSTDQVRLRAQPEYFMSYQPTATAAATTTPFFVDTNVLNTNFYNAAEIEMATSFGPFHTEGEITMATVDRIAAQTVTFMGGFFQAGYILTGEHRAYNLDNAAPARVTPSNPFRGTHGIGAWEVAGRISYINLDDKDVQGGKLTDLTAGLNWYLNKYTKFQANYIRALLDNPVNGNSTADLFLLRAQLDF